MNDFLSKLSIYDQLGYLAVGGMFYVFLQYDQTYISLNLSAMAASPFSVAIVVYFLGHTAQTVARKINKPEQIVMDATVLNDIRNAVANQQLETLQAFQICYLYALTVDKTGHVEIMNARYGLYRGWAFVLAFQAVCFLVIFGVCL